MSGTPDKAPDKALKRRHLRVGLVAAVGAVGMVGAAYAAVPIYKAFCQLTGFHGTLRKASAAPTVQLDRKLRVAFDTNVRDGLPWTFTPEKPSMEVKIGATGMAFFK